MNDIIVEKVVEFAKAAFVKLNDADIARNKSKEPKDKVPLFLSKVQNSKTQFQDIIVAASQATSVEEFKLYIAYKAAKDGIYGLWKAFGQELNEFIKADIEQLDCDEKEKLVVLHQAMGYLMWAAYAFAEGMLQYV
jgi:hypothetical protein